MLEHMDKRALGEKLRRLRTAAKLSQEDLALKSKVAHRAIQRIESGNSNPTVDTLQTLAHFFKVSFEDLTGQSPRQSLTESLAKQSQSDPALKEAARILAALSSAGPNRRAVIYYLLFQEQAYLDGLQSRDLIQKALSKVP